MMVLGIRSYESQGSQVEMYPSVTSFFRVFNEPLEGVVAYMYLDIKGLVTVGVGNLIDP